MKTKVSESIERNAAIYCMLQVANEAMRRNQPILLNLKNRTK